MNSKTDFLGTMKEGKLLLKMSLPTVLALLIVALYNIVDAIFVGAHSEALFGLGALTVAFPVQLLLAGIGQLFGMGAATLFSRLMGEKKSNPANKTVGNAIVSIALVGVVLTAVGTVFTKEVMQVAGASEEVLPLAIAYGRIILMGSVLHLFANAATHIVRAEGSALKSMIFMSVGSVLNIPLDYLFVLKMNLGVSGAAIATVISTGVSCALFMAYIFSRRSAFLFSKQSFTLSKKTLLNTVAAGFPGFAICTLGIVLMLIINLTVKSLNTPSLYAITGIINRIAGVIYMPISGIMLGLLPIISYNYGAGNTQRIRKTIRLAVIVSTGICSACFIALMLLAEPVVQAFIQADAPVFDTAVDALRISNIILPLAGVAMMTTGICQGLGNVKAAAASSVLRSVLLIVLVIILAMRMGFWGIVWAFPVADALSLIAVGCILLRTVKSLKKDDSASSATAVGAEKEKLVDIGAR